MAQPIIKNQLTQRNLSRYDRSVLALQLEPLYAAEAKRRMQAGGKSAEMGRQNSDNPQRTDDQLAKMAGISRDTPTRRPGGDRTSPSTPPPYPCLRISAGKRLILRPLETSS